ncbi:MAG: hypothetical protein AAF677_01630 [Pseudomonadota bacterium]
MIRTIVVLCLALGILWILFLAADLWLRRDTKRRLVQRYAEEAQRGEHRDEDRESFVNRGLAEYGRSTERRLLAGLLTVPLIVIGALMLYAE